MVEDVPFFRIVKNDYAALLLLILAPCLLGAVAFKWMELSSAERAWSLGIVAAVGLGCAVLLWRRIDAIRQTLRSGMRLRGTIHSVWFMKDRGRLEFEYKYAGTRRAGVAINKNKMTEALREGQEIDLALDPQKPDKPLVLGLYLEQGFLATEAVRRPAR